jgi:site-specific DNA-cytosine methylase
VTVPVERPAPTITAAAIEKDQWVLRTGANSMKHSRRSDDVVPYERDVDRPAPVVDKKASQWVFERPATVVQGDPRIFSPGGHLANDGRDNSKMVGRSENAIRVELHELAALQDFPDEYPFQGNKTQKARQIGNAVPRTLARVIVEAVA